MLQPLSLLWSLDRGRANLHCTYICENVGNSFFTPNRFHSARKFVFEATMDGEDMEPDSGFLPNECASRVDGGVDRISQLPNEILFLILSLLPVRKAASTTVLSSRWLNLWKEIPNLKFNLKSDRISQLPDKTLIAILSFLRLQEAAATSVLSSRWSDLWKHSPCLDFDPYDVDSGHQIWDATGFEVVNSVIQLHKALSLKKFRISYPVKKSDKSAVTKCLDFAFSRKVESLELDFQCWDDSDKFILQESLRESSICGDPQTLIFLKSLVSLHLECLKVSGEDIEMFLRNCPLLEELMIHSATLTSDVEVCGTTDLMLKRLEIYYCKGESSITVSAPNLTWITFRKGLGSGAKLSIESAPKLVGAAFTTKDPNFVGLQFACISQLQILILRSYYPMEFWAKDFPEMPNLKKLVIECCGGHNHSLLQVITLIRASPRFEEFTYKGTGSIIVPSAWIGVIPNVERPKPQSLKVFELQMPDYLAVNDDIVELVMYVLDNCVQLQKIVVGRWLWLPGSGITAEMRADANYILQRLQSKVVPNHIQLQFFGCDVVM